jgi:hypothetical protein
VFLYYGRLGAGVTVCKMNRSWEQCVSYSLGSLYSAQMLVHLVKYTSRGKAAKPRISSNINISYFCCALIVQFHSFPCLFIKYRGTSLVASGGGGGGDESVY